MSRNISTDSVTFSFNLAIASAVFAKTLATIISYLSNGLFQKKIPIQNILRHILYVRYEL